MNQLKFFVSPHFSEEAFEDKVSGATYKKSNDITVYSARVADDKMAGLMEGFRKNFIIPYDKATAKLINGLNVTTVLTSEPEVEQSPVVEETPTVAAIAVEDEPAVATVAAEEAPKKKASTRKRSQKKVEPKTEE